MKIHPTKLRLATALCALGAIAQVACAQGNANDGSIYQFIDAERQKSSPNAMYQYEQSMQGTLFAVYPEYWRLNYNLASQDPQTVNSFVAKYPSQVMSEKLAADYAEVKARQSDYASVRAVAHSIENADDSEACAIALGYNQSSESYRTLEQKHNVWLNTQIRQSLCDKLATEMVDNPRISRTDQHEQLIRMMRIDRRQLSSRQAPLDKASDIINLSSRLGLPISYETLRGIANNPNGFFSQFAMSGYSEVNQYLYVYAISQLAHRSYTEALLQLEFDINQDKARSQKLLSDMARRYAYRSIAVKRMNMNTDDGFSADAVTWFRQSVGEPFNFEEAEDYAQAAIYFGQWQDVVSAISSMTVAKQGERIWQYWLARGYEQTGKQAEAKRIYQTLATGVDYYGLLAKDRLGQRLSLSELGGSALPNISNKDAQRVMQNPHFARAFLMMENGVANEHVSREWNWAVRSARNSNDNTLALAAAKRAHDLGLYHRSISAIDNMPNLRAVALSHPMPYQSSVTAYSRQVGIDPAWAYGIMRQESRFQPNARSGVGAGGLMQIMPGTASQIARGMGESAGNMNHPETNIRYGTWFLNDLANRAGGQIAVATAGYNAGPGAARKWLPTHGSISADQYVEAIPYAETREYVKHVMENATIYGALMGNGMTITQRMGTVSPRY
ncbi:lytic transglycosylase domain-containing protein [Moraxella nasibovis]|uniref:lytic transglycosylase domain-containing protein n=1 Tax=Moraxella nasibovis TaxID=2904120 RepID=UPI002410B130|nr:lytic transglycosylase domain-containing protein [Moraxella nasibovis]WFF38216.1 lytic transglycosylase domain-containing protein [Moraxella nasibovis]